MERTASNEYVILGFRVFLYEEFAEKDYTYSMNTVAVFVFKVPLSFESMELIFCLWHPTGRCKKNKHFSGFKNSSIL